MEEIGMFLWMKTVNQSDVAEYMQTETRCSVLKALKGNQMQGRTERNNLVNPERPISLLFKMLNRVASEVGLL